MHFKNPEYLPLYLFVLIPIIIHFLKFNRYVEFYYSNVNLIKNLVNKSKKYNQIRDILLLIIRTIFILFLVSIFTKPTFNNNINSKKEDTLIVYFDNDLSTEFIYENQTTILEKSKNDIISLLDDNTFNPKNIIIVTNNSDNTFNDKENVKREILKIKPYYKKLSLENIYQKIELLSTRHNKTNKKIILITTKPNNINYENENINFIKYKPININNILIKDLLLISNNTNKEIKVLVQSNIKENIHTTIKIYTYKNEKYTLMNVKNIQIKNYIDTVSFFLEMPLNDNYISGKIVVDDNISPIDFDNDFFFTINNTPNKNISLIKNKKTGNNFFVSKVFDYPNINFKSFDKSNININDIKKSNIIIYDELLNLDYNDIKEIDNFLEEGKNIIIIPNINSEIQNINELTSFFEICKTKNIENKKIFIEKINNKNKFFKNVFEGKLDENLDLPFAQKYFITENIGSDILAYFSNGNPAIFYKKYKNGYILFPTFSFDTENSNIYSHSIIVPLLYKNLDMYEKNELYVTLGENYSKYFLTDNINNKSSIYIKSQNEKIIPNYTINSEKELKIYNSPLPENNGIYSIFVDNNKINEISYNLPRNYLIFSDDDKLKIQNIKDIKINITSEFKNDIFNGKILIIISLLLLLIEILIINKKQK